MKENLIQYLRQWKSESTGPFFDLADPPRSLIEEALPKDYLEIVTEYGGREGFLGNEYLRLYRYEELLSLNQAYGVPEYVPELFIFGSNGSGEAYAFVIVDKRVVMVPFIPLDLEHAILISNGFTEFIERMSRTGPSGDTSKKSMGLELTERQPILFGGDSKDPENKIMIPPNRHAELARFWNKAYTDIKNRN